MLAPFVRGVAGELDGYVDSDAKLHVQPGLKNGAMSGAIVVDRGVFETTAIGQELHGVRARITMKPWGVWNVNDISARGTSGGFRANAIARVDGLHFESGELHFDITQKDQMPLTVQGVEYGRAWGHLDATAKNVAAAGTDAIDVAVKIPTLHVELPQSIGHAVQSTEPNPKVSVGAILPDGSVDILPVDGLRPPEKPKPKPPPNAPPSLEVRIAAHLGPNIEVRRSSMLRAYVQGDPTIVIGRKTTLAGQIEVPRGYVELQGKRFKIEKATVRFSGQPSDNPLIFAEAMYEATDGTKVYANFVGPVKSGKLTLRSEPVLSQNEILALLLFGSADGTFGQSAPPGQQKVGATQAASLAGGFVSEGLNKALTGVSGVQVQTKVDTQQQGNPRPEVEVAISRNVSATVIYNLGVPPPGQNPDDTLLRVDWRFHHDYSAQATLGNRGTSILDRRGSGATERARPRATP